jgi:hypothetical protein
MLCHSSGCLYFLERTSDLAEHTAGVVHENVDASHFADEPIDRALVGDVHDAPGAAAETLRRTQLGFDDVARPHARAMLSQRDTDRAPESVRGARDDRRLP